MHVSLKHKHTYTHMAALLRVGLTGSIILSRLRGAALDMCVKY